MRFTSCFEIGFILKTAFSLEGHLSLKFLYSICNLKSLQELATAHRTALGTTILETAMVLGEPGPKFSGNSAFNDVLSEPFIAKEGPLSNWTELDIWQYIHLEEIPIVPLYLAKPRPVVERDGVLILVDDDRLPLEDGETPMMKTVRFRTLGCYPLTGAVESEADTLPEIIQEMLLTTTSERQGRVIDFDSSASMEKKKQEGYF